MGRAERWIGWLWLLAGTGWLVAAFVKFTAGKLPIGCVATALAMWCVHSGILAFRSPTPAAPAGSGWLTQPPEFIPYSKESWQAEAHAQRARAEAAERERDEAYASHSAVADIAIRGGIKGIGHLNRIATLEAALSAATAREAGLRALCEEALQVAEAYCPRQRDIGDCASCGALRARLASLAAPEGGET